MKIQMPTPEQETAILSLRQKYFDIACGGGRIDREALAAALADIYALIERPEPELFMFDSPAACARFIAGCFEQRADFETIPPFGKRLRFQLYDQQRQLDEQLWRQIGDWIDDSLIGQISNQLWDQLRCQLGDQLIKQLRSQLGFVWDDGHFWGSQALYRIAWARCAQYIGVELDDETDHRLTIMERISTQCEWWWPYENVVVASERPTLVGWDAQGRLHAEDGPAVEYADGFNLYSRHGKFVPNEIMDERESDRSICHDNPPF